MLGLIPRNKVRNFYPPTYGNFFPPTYGPVAPRMELPLFLGKFREEFEKFFEPFFGFTPQLTGWRWGLEFEETEEALIIRAEAPGFEPGDFEVYVQENYLFLSVHCKKELMEKGKPMVKEERICQEILPLPPGVIPEKFNALYKNGVLFITLPRKPEAKKFKVPVQCG